MQPITGGTRNECVLAQDFDVLGVSLSETLYLTEFTHLADRASIRCSWFVVNAMNFLLFAALNAHVKL